MSMTISAANYLNSTPQNIPSAAPERPEQRGAASEVGKTEQSNLSASLDQVNMGEDGISIPQVRRQQGAEQIHLQKQPNLPRMDTVEISEEGKAASIKSQENQTGSSAAEGYQYEEEDLSQYTDTELKLMYYNGDITLQEYEDETGETLGETVE